MQDFSRALFGLSAQFEDQLDQQAEAEASKEGAIAGLTGNTEEQTYQTIRGRAYNKAMLTTFVTSMETKAMLGAQRIEQENWDNPTEMERALNGFYGGIAAEVEKVAPGAGAAFTQRQTAAAIGAVERARDTRFKLTQDEASAMLVQREQMASANMTRYAGDLFSDNPSQSSAASAVVAQSINDYMQIYDAVDDLTGKPLFSKEAKAKAQIFIQEKVMYEAALGWADKQDDPATAYQKIMEKDFSFNINAPEQTGAPVVMANSGSKRNLPIKSEVKKYLEVAGGALGPGVKVHVQSGGQVTREEARRGKGLRTGSTRHDHGGAADVYLTVNGQRVTPAENPRLYEQFLENAAAAGATGLGHYSWGVHVGGGSEAAWGPSTKGNTLAGNYEAAINRGRQRFRASGPLTLQPGQSQTKPLRSMFTEQGWNRLDAELRQRVTFANQQEDRIRKAEEEGIKQAQDRAETEITMRIYAEGTKDPATGRVFDPITPEEVNAIAKVGGIDETKAQAFIKAITTEKPERSDPAIYQELQRRMWAGEDVQDDIITAAGSLRREDMNALLDKNRQLRLADGELSKEEQRYFSEIEKVIAPPGEFGFMDPDRAERALDAKIEFLERARRRGETGETLTDIINDVRDRYRAELFRFAGDAIKTLPLPRFYVSAGTDDRRINLQETAKALLAKKSSGEISEEIYRDQIDLLKKWSEAQRDADERAAAAESKKKK